VLIGADGMTPKTWEHSSGDQVTVKTTSRRATALATRSAHKFFDALMDREGGSLFADMPQPAREDSPVRRFHGSSVNPSTNKPRLVAECRRAELATGRREVGGQVRRKTSASRLWRLAHIRRSAT
jgi:hypothetical protein